MRLEGFEGPEAGLAALTLMQVLLKRLEGKGAFSGQEVREMVDTAIAFHEGASDDGFSAPNERVAILLRAAFSREG